ncbi:MAG: 2Fe-2S iron-sulfur cluster binding domain-containing protein [Methylobacter sp.]|nr:MAG: 2Fe-2S iron-sulfur cluster binding domain-containing protein [Methylobacter sp.]
MRPVPAFADQLPNLRRHHNSRSSGRGGRLHRERLPLRTCGLCRVKLLSGKVRMAVEDSLTESEKKDGYILACQAEVETDVEIDA